MHLRGVSSPSESKPSSGDASSCPGRNSICLRGAIHLRWMRLLNSSSGCQASSEKKSSSGSTFSETVFGIRVRLPEKSRPHSGHNDKGKYPIFSARARACVHTCHTWYTWRDNTFFPIVFVNFVQNQTASRYALSNVKFNASAVRRTKQQ